MNIENYKTFIVLASTESFSKTAEQMNVVQSTVSSRIVELEKHLDAKLFKRNRRLVEITHAGKLLLPHANKIVNVEYEAKQMINSTDLFEDNLKISVTGSIYREKLSPIINEFYKLYPHYGLDIRFYKTSHQLEKLFDDESDIGFITRFPSSPKVEVIQYLEYSWVLIAHPDYDISDTIDVSILPTLDLSIAHLNEDFNKWLEDVSPRNFRSRLNINSTTQLIEYVNRGYGCAFVPKYSVEEDLKTGKLKEITVTNITHNKFINYIAINKKRRNSDVVKKFLDLIPEYQEHIYNIL